MKKTIICLLALCLLCSGCASREAAPSEVPAGAEVSPMTSDVAEEPAEEPSPEPKPETTAEPIPVHSKGQIWLYGENHSDPKCLEKELEIWGAF